MEATKSDFVNVFDMPIRYRKEILDKIIVPQERRRKFTGKSFTCVFFTKFCDAGCPFCFFRSDTRKYEIPQEMFEFSDYGFEKFINFLNASNNGYLLISGGGEPFEKKEYVFQTIKRAKTDRIVIVTSGLWAKKFAEAKEMIFQLYENLRMRGDNTKLVLRLSVDQFHYQQLGFDVVNNIIKVFRENFSNNHQFELRIHTMIGDKTIHNIAKKIGGCEVVDTNENCVSDNESIIKIVPHKCKIVFDDEYEVYIGMAKRFYPNLMVDLNSELSVTKKAVQVFAQDMELSEYNNPSVVTNANYTLGLDFWINYNGNITTWGNQQLDNLSNLYVDDYAKITSDIYRDIISYSFVDKGYHYREAIVNEVNPKAALRSIAINIRDYTGAIILEEVKTALYYAIRVIQEYKAEGVLTEKELNALSPELCQAINSDVNQLISNYKNSAYTIFHQYMDIVDFVDKKWIDLFTLVRLGHYDVSDEQIQEALQFYNKNTSCPISNIEDVIHVNHVEQYGRLIERITFMKPEAKEKCMLLKEDYHGN